MRLTTQTRVYKKEYRQYHEVSLAGVRALCESGGEGVNCSTWWKHKPSGLRWEPDGGFNAETEV